MGHDVLAVALGSLSPAGGAAVLARLIVAALAGGVIGWERGRAGRRDGLRPATRALAVVALVAAAVTLASVDGFRQAGLHDAGRVAAQLAVGIGFIGAGAIVVLGRSARDLTAGATAWVVVAIGLAAGAGMYVLALAGAALATAVLELLARGSGEPRPRA